MLTLAIIWIRDQGVSQAYHTSNICDILFSTSGIFVMEKSASYRSFLRTVLSVKVKTPWTRQLIPWSLPHRPSHCGSWENMTIHQSSKLWDCTRPSMGGQDLLWILTLKVRIHKAIRVDNFAMQQSLMKCHQNKQQQQQNPNTFAWELARELFTPWVT